LLNKPETIAVEYWLTLLG